MPNQVQRELVLQDLEVLKIKVMITATDIVRGQSLQVLGFHSFDALHLASAEKALADIFLTTDDRLKKIADRHKSNMNLRVENPLIWLQEQI